METKLIMVDGNAYIFDAPFLPINLHLRLLLVMVVLHISVVKNSRKC